MYAVYCYKVGSTQAQVLSDLIAILTGTTSVGSLSASCVPGSTNITATVAAGWLLHDASAGTNKQVIKATCQDGTTTKYVALTMTTTAAWEFTVYESWNAGTHAGTNTVTRTGQVWDATNGGFFYIYATQKNIIIMPWTAAGGYGVTPACLELTRETIPATYPCWVLSFAGNASPSFLSGAGAGGIPRIKNPTAVGDTLTPTVCLGALTAAGTWTTAPSAFYRDASDTQYYNLFQLACASNTAANCFFLGLGYDVRGCAFNAGVAALDELTYSGTTYVAFSPASTVGVFWVPKQ